MPSRRTTTSTAATATTSAIGARPTRRCCARWTRPADPAEQRERLHAIQRRLSDDAVNGFLFQYPRPLVRRADLHGLGTNGIGGVDLAGAFFEGASADGQGASVGSGSRAASGLAGARWLFLALALVGAALAAAWLAWVAVAAAIPAGWRRAA